jgi:hypothetical protein
VNRFDGIGDVAFREDGILTVSSDDVRHHDRFFASSSKMVE